MQEDIGENKKTSEKASERKASHRARVASRREFQFLFHCIIHSPESVSAIT